MGYCPLNPNGWTFIVVPAVCSLISLTFSPSLSILFAFTSLFLSYFFRDPKRSVPLHNAVVLSPSDGVVTSVELVDSPLGNGTLVTRVSVFLSLFNVHVNRTPVSGVVKSVNHRPGKFLNAFKKESITQNEMVRTVFQTHVGNYTLVTEQLAGLVCKRVVCELKPGDQVTQGSRMGIIKFGSRVNMYLPQDLEPMVFEGQKVKGGETVFAYLDPKLANSREEFTYEKV